MAAVLVSEDTNYFTSSLRRSHSSPRFSDTSSPFNSATPTLHDQYTTPTQHFSHSPSSSAPSSPQIVQAESASELSYSSTPATNLSIASDFEEVLSIDEAPEDHFGFPQFSADKFCLDLGFHNDESSDPPPSPKNGDPYAVSPDRESFEGTSRPSTPEFGDHAEDDTAATTKPSRQVDYLSHNWREEDIWSSWRYIVNRRGEFANSARLENASWRTWVKAKNNLKTISPETLNWSVAICLKTGSANTLLTVVMLRLKDCDVTWLYGPLQSGSCNLFTTQTEPSSRSLSKQGSQVNLSKKPILKKRSMSEVMLQRSLSTASLLKQATAAVQAQESRGRLRPNMDRAHTNEYIAYPLSARRFSRAERSSMTSSVDSSELTSPSVERRHIHFNEQVEQCIAVDVKGDDEDEGFMGRFMGDSDSDEGVMMKRMKTKPRSHSRSKPKRCKRTTQEDGKIIAMLPSTTLKYREDTPERQETAMKHSTGTARGLISPSSSQETLRPTRASTRFHLDEDEEGDLGDDIVPSSLGWRSPPYDAGLHGSTSSSSLVDEPVGMRRTASGMFMPYDEGDMSANEGIFGRVIDTVNTARDIAHVIWNVGWRK